MTIEELHDLLRQKLIDIGKLGPDEKLTEKSRADLTKLLQDTDARYAAAKGVEIKSYGRAYELAKRLIERKHLPRDENLDWVGRVLEIDIEHPATRRHGLRSLIETDQAHDAGNN